MTRVLVVDDDRSLRLALKKALGRKGVEVVEAADGQAALEPLNKGAVDEGPVDACVLDLRMPGIDGMEVLRRTVGRSVPVVVLTGHGTIPDAVEAMRLGAANFVQKPVDADELWPVLAQTLGTAGEGDGGPMLGESEAMLRLSEQLDRAAASDEPVLLLGETGTGKELAARRLHDVSARAEKSFIAFNAACVPKDLFESELFGHKKGSFTGADRDRKGLMEEAADGTLFLDEVGDLPLDGQVKLLRAIEDRRFRPVGSNSEKDFDARIVAATHQSLQRMVEASSFRADLYYRLGVIPIELPPLRERGDDVLLIARAWLARLAGDDEPCRLSADAASRLLAYAFPGNVRELINLMKRAVIFARGPEVDGALLDELLRNSPFASLQGDASSSTARGPAAGERVTLEELEREHITRLLGELNNVSEVARIVGIDRRTLQRKMIAWGLRDADG
jgi:DNA-binding NtrC family response regulator